MRNDTYPIIGMSPGNSYFSEENIKYLLDVLLSEYEEVTVMIADIPAIQTYVALGYPENRAKTDKAIRNSNNIKNRVRKVIEANDVFSGRIKILDWAEEVEPNEGYQAKYLEVQNIYNNNTDFRNACNETTRLVLESSGREIQDIEWAISTAVHHLLAELAFLEAAPTFLSKVHVTYIYHNNWKVYEDFIAGNFDGINRTNRLGFRVIKNPDELS